MNREKAREYYLVFISIVFGIFVTSWADPLVRTLKTQDALAVGHTAIVRQAIQHVLEGETNSALTETFRTNLVSKLTTNVTAKLHPQVATTTDHSLRSVFTDQQWQHGILTLLVIIALWWWYGVFLRWFAPAEGFVMYLFDFVSLSCFAVATGLWSSLGNGFPLTVSIASVLISTRFFFARRATRKVARAKLALLGAMITVGVFGGASLLVWAGAVWRGGNLDLETYKIVTLGFMLLSIVVTCVAVWMTEGLWWQRAFLPGALEMPDRLLPPADTLKRINYPLSLDALRNLQRRAHVEFQQRCVSLGLHRCGADLNSAVHTSEDLHNQVLLAAFASDGSAEDILKRFKVMYFVHWLDDVLDQRKYSWCQLKSTQSKLVERGCKKDIEGYEELFDGPLKGHRALAGEIRSWFKSPTGFDLGIQRLIIGSFVFKPKSKHWFGEGETDLQDRAREGHKTLLKQHGIRDELILAENQCFADLSTKTVTEFWHGMESGTVDYKYVLLFSLLYGPGLYYHDVDEERLANEHSETWRDPNEDRVAAFVEQVGGLLDGMIEKDPRKASRVWEVAAFTECFSNVFPAKVKKAYDKVVTQLGDRIGILRSPEAH